MTEIKKSKFENDVEHEPISDLYIYFPISDFLNEIFHKFGFKPNHITILSTISTIYSVYCFSKRKKSCFFFYFLGYLFDSMDGRMARKYNQGSTLGMILDLVTDNFATLPLIFLFICDVFKKSTKDRKRKVLLLILLIIFTYMLALTYGTNEAIISYVNTKSDNFYKYKEKIIQNSEYNDTFLGKIFMKIIKKTYKAYRKMSPQEINDENLPKLKKKLLKFKEFGPGNYNLFMIYMMLEFF